MTVTTISNLDDDQLEFLAASHKIPLAELLELEAKARNFIAVTTHKFAIGDHVTVCESDKVSYQFHGETGVIEHQTRSTHIEKQLFFPINGDLRDTECLTVEIPCADIELCYQVTFLNKKLPTRFLGLCESEITRA